MRRAILKFAVLGIMSVSLALCVSADLKPRASRKAAPDFTTADAKNAPVQLSAYKGKVVLLDFWATWCHGCKTEIPWYVEFQDRYKQKGLAAVGVAMDEDGWKSVKPFLQQTQINYPVVVGNWEKMSKAFGFSSLPVTLLIDREGKIADFHEGMVDKASFEKEIQQLLGESGSGPN
jgi:peroxiredoxin